MKRMILFLILLFITGCNLGYEANDPNFQIINPTTAISSEDSEKTEDVHENEESCFAPLITNYYEAGYNAAPYIEEEVPLSNAWEVVSVIPPEFSGETGYVYFLTWRNAAGNDEFWYYSESPNLIIIRYIVQEDRWELVGTKETLGIPSLKDADYFFDNAGNIWVYKNCYGGSCNYGSIPMLSKYDNDVKKFVELSIPLDINEEPTLSIYIRKALSDANGNIWLLLENVETQQSTLFEYDVNSVELNKFSYPDYTIYDFILTTDNLLYLAVSWDGKISLIQFDPNTGYQEAINNPLNDLEVSYHYSISSDLFTDRQKRIWFSGSGYYDTVKAQWTGIFPSSIFMSPGYGDGRWHWNPPVIFKETSDGKLWFTSVRGGGWLNPDSGEWCLITSYSISSLTEDSDGNLYILDPISWNRILSLRGGYK